MAEAIAIEGSRLTMAPPQVLHFLTEEEQNLLPPEIKSKTSKAFADLNKNFQITLTQKHKERVGFEEQLSQLSKLFEDEKLKSESLTAQLTEEKKATEEYIDKYRNTLTTNNEIEDNFRKIQKDHSEVKIKFDQLLAEKDELLTLVNKRNSDVEKYLEDNKNLANQLQSATIAKIEAIVKVDELQSKEMELDYKEKTLEKEKEWVSKQVSLLNEELDRKNAELIEVQKESRLKYMNIQMELFEKSEQQRIAELALENVKKSNEEQEKHIESLIQKLRDEQDVENKMEENYRQELKSQRKIADLYKESSEEANKKTEELEDAITNLQELLKMATERFGDLESRFERAGKSFQDEITQRDEKITNYQKEISHANELISNIKKQGLTDEMIHALSPSAASAAQMLKSSKSLTEIYSKYQEIHSELLTSRYENEKLNNYIREILMEIEEKAPLVTKQMRELNETNETVEALTHQLDISMSETSNCKDELGQARKSLAAVERENSRMNVQVSDMALQIKALLKEIESFRGNYSYDDEDRDVPEMDSSSVISQRLVTFKNIDELQSQNQHLLAVIRELSENQEKDNREHSEKHINELREAHEAATNEIIELRKIRERFENNLAQDSMKQKDVSSILMQKSPTKRASTDDSANQQVISDLEKKVWELETTLKKVNEEYDTYRKEKATNDKISQDQMEKLRDSVMKMRTDNSKLASQTEYNNERAKIYKNNLETYKKNIELLEQKNKSNNLIIMKHEESLSTLRNELKNEQSLLARAEVSLSTTVQERNALKDSKIRLEAENELFKRERKTQQILQINLEEIKNNLEMSYSAGKMKLENKVQSLEEEMGILRRKLDQENEQFRETVFSWDKANNELQEKLKTEIENLRLCHGQLAETKEVILAQKNEIDELKMKVLNSSGPLQQQQEQQNQNQQQQMTSNSSKIQLENKTKELNLKLIDSQTEIKSLNNQLTVVKESLEEYKKLCSSMEEQIVHLRSDSSHFENELNERLNLKDQIIREIESKLELSEKENFSMKNMKDQDLRELETKSLQLEEEVNRMQRDLQSANRQIQNYIEENVAIKNDLEQNIEKNEEMKKKYEEEMTQHANEVKVSSEIKMEMDSLRDRVCKEERLRRQAEEKLAELIREYEVNQGNQTRELEELRRNLSELEALNTSLQDQLVNQTTQLISIRRTENIAQDSPNMPNTSLNQSFNTSFGENDPANSEQWLQLVRYLRREKEIAKTKSEMDQASAQRLENQLTILERQYDEAKKQLAELQDRSQVSIITSVKQADLLRKVETLSAIIDSNSILREEKDKALEEIEILTIKLTSIESEMTPLKSKMFEIENRCEVLQNENAGLKQDSQIWKSRCSALIEKSKSINPEDFKKLQEDKDNLTKQHHNLSEMVKKQQLDIVRQANQVKMLQQQLSVSNTNLQALEQVKKVNLEEIKVTNDERNKLKEEVQSIRNELKVKIELIDNLEKESVTIKDNCAKAEKDSLEQKATAKAVKGIARRYKKQFEDLEVELKEMTAVKEELDAQVQTLTTSLTESESKLAEKMEIVQEKAIEIEKIENGTMTDPQEAVVVEGTSVSEQEIKTIKEENEVLKRENESIKAESGVKDEKAKVVLKTFRERLTATNAQKSEIETELNQLKSQLNLTVTSNEEANVRLAALKSQYEGRINRLEKENKDYKDAAENSTLTTSESMANVQKENLRLQKELEMHQQRNVVLEKQYKLQTQQQQQQAKQLQGSVSTLSSSEKVQASDPPKANIKPQISSGSGSSTSQQQQKQQNLTQAQQVSGRPLTASIKPMSQPRKATVMPQASASTSTTSSQQQQQQSVSPFVSQGQVSTSTPDQSSAAGGSNLPEDSNTQIQQQQHTNTPSTSGSTLSSSSVRQATVQPTPTITITPTISGPILTQSQQQQQQGTSTAQQSSNQERDNTSTTTQDQAHEDPTTSQLDDYEMSDSNEQVSSSEPSSKEKQISSRVQQQQDKTTQPGSSHTELALGLEEPSPSTSSLGSRPTQSGGKRTRDNEVETSSTSQKSQVSSDSNQPESKRTRVSMPVEREAEAMAHQQHEEEVDEDYNDQDEDDEETEHFEEPHSETTGEIKSSTSAYRDQQQQMAVVEDEDDDDDVIVISDDDEEDNDEVVVQSQQVGRPSQKQQQQQQQYEDYQDDDEDIEEEEDEEIEEDEELEEEEDENEDEEDDDDHMHHQQIGQDEDDHDEEGDDEDHNIQGQDDEDEGREAESLEQEDLMIQDDAEAAADDGGEVMEEPSSGGDNNLQQQQQMPGTSSTTDDMTARPLPLSRPVRQGHERLPSLSRQQQLTPSAFHQPQQMFGDEGLDEGIVPCTPTLFVPRRSDGFAEAVNSPRVPSQGGRFTFTSTPSDTTTSSYAVPTMEDTRVDLLQYDESSGRSVPTTPSHLDQVVIDHQQLHHQQQVGDIQPSSSDNLTIIRQQQQAEPEVPSITITSASGSGEINLDDDDNDNDQEGDDEDIIGEASQEEEEEDQETSEADNIQQQQQQPLSTTLRPESSVTSSNIDEDKIDGSSKQQQQPSTSSTLIRTTSPTPSSDQQQTSIQLQQQQKQQQQQQSRLRPVPIVWDQPTSSSPSGPSGGGPVAGGLAMARSNRGGRGTGRGLSMSTVQQQQQQLQQQDPAGGLLGFRQLARGGPSQSARRSRPHGRGPMMRKGPY